MHIVKCLLVVWMGARIELKLDERARPRVWRRRNRTCLSHAIARVLVGWAHEKCCVDDGRTLSSVASRWRAVRKRCYIRWVVARSGRGETTTRTRRGARLFRTSRAFVKMITPRARRPTQFLCLATLALISNMTHAAEPLRVLPPSAGTPNPAVLLVPGCSGFVARNGINHYEERASELQAAGYFVVFVDYLSRRHLTDCAGGRDVSHAEVAADILEAAAWTKGQVGVSSDKIFVIGWSYGGGGVLAALNAMPPGPPTIAKAVAYYPDCRRAMPWSSTSVSVLMLMGAMDEVAFPALCDRAMKGAPPNSLHSIFYPNARHGFDMRGLPERAEFGRLGYNAEAARASWMAVLDFLR